MDSACAVRAGADGPFTVNLWFRGNGSDMSGELFEYIFSHSAYATRTLPSPVSSFQANQARPSMAVRCPCPAEQLPSIKVACLEGGFAPRRGRAPSFVCRASALVKGFTPERRQQFKASHRARVCGRPQ